MYWIMFHWFDNVHENAWCEFQRDESANKFWKFDNQVLIWITVHRFTFACFIPFFQFHCGKWRKKCSHLMVNETETIVPAASILNDCCMNYDLSKNDQRNDWFQGRHQTSSLFCFECSISILLQNLFVDDDDDNVCGLLSLQPKILTILIFKKKKKILSIHIIHNSIESPDQSQRILMLL